MDRSRTRSPPDHKGRETKKDEDKIPIKVETIEQYREYVNTVKYWQSIKKYDGKRKERNM